LTDMDRSGDNLYPLRPNHPESVKLGKVLARELAGSG
jgi:hypothetical protein